MKDFFKKLFSKHYGMERFGLSFLILCVFFVGITGSLMITSYKTTHQSLTSKAIYTESFKMSRTGVNGTVAGVFTNENHTKALLLLKFDDVSKLSVDANNYTIFLRGLNNNSMEIEPLKSNPSGAIYMFGTSGYMGIYFVDTTGFENQIWYLTLRNDKEIVNVSTDDVDIDEGKSDQYAELDLADIYFNPAASETTIVSCLDNDVVTVHDMYEECITREDEQEIRKTLDTDLKNMRADLATIAEYEDRLESWGIALNQPYPCIAGDYMVNQDGDVVASMDNKADLVSYKESDDLYLKSSHVLSSGADFDWRNGSVYEGYLSDLAGADTIDNYVYDLQHPDASDDKTVSNTWYYKKDGSEFTVDNSGGFSQSTSEINSTIQCLTSAWDSYYNHKVQYECKDLVSLLELEYSITYAESNYTVNNSSNMMHVTR